MRRVAVVIAGGVVGAAGCFAPFSWPDERRAERGATPEPATSAMALVSAAPEADHLALAADRLERGDDTGALPHLSAHVEAHPDAVMIRAYLAELLVRTGKPDEARCQFERVVADAQRQTGPARTHLVHCHTRLMEIASAGADPYAEPLHRGIGLLLLVRKWDAESDRHDTVSAEQTLAKAAKALRAAAAERPGDPRANLYLGEVYERMGQRPSARSAWRTARANLPDPALTPWEGERLAEPLN